MLEFQTFLIQGYVLLFDFSMLFWQKMSISFHISFFTLTVDFYPQNKDINQFSLLTDFVI